MKKSRFPNNEVLIVGLIFIVFFLLIEVVLRMYNAYYHFPEVDIPSHIFAGMAILIAVYWILSVNRVKSKIIFSIFYTFIIAIVWEIIETLQELVIDNPPHLRDIFFWDGFFDIIFTIVGGLFGLVFLYILRRITNLKI